MEKMKVVCLINDLGSGGAERQLTYLAAFLSEREYDVEVWTCFPEDFFLPYLREKNVKYRYIPGLERVGKRIPGLVRELSRSHPEVLIAFMDNMCIIGCIYKIFHPSVRLIVSERNTTQKCSFMERAKFFLYRWADAVVPNSQAQGRYIEKHFPHLLEKTHVITNYIDTEAFRPSATRGNGGIIVGRIMPQKNPLLLMEAVKRLVKDDRYKDFHLTWYGKSVNENYWKLVEKRYLELELQNHITFKNPEMEINRRYPEYDFFCLPSIYEGYPNVVCEAMSCGLPVLCSDVCDNAYIVDEGECGYLFNPLDIDDMVRAFKRYVSLSEDEKMAMAARCLKKVERICSKQEFTDSYIDLFNKKILRS